MRRQDPHSSEQSNLAHLMTLVQEGDRVAFNQLYERTIDRAYTLTRTLLRESNDIEDALSECFIQLWEKRANYDPSRGNVIAWILIIARSRALDIIRRRKPSVDQVEEQAAENDGLPLDEFSPDMQKRLSKAMSNLTPIQRQMVALSFLKGFTHEEIALAQGLPIGTVKSHIRRGLGALRKNLVDWEDYYE